MYVSKGLKILTGQFIERTWFRMQSHRSLKWFLEKVAVVLLFALYKIGWDFIWLHAALFSFDSKFFLSFIAFLYYLVTNHACICLAH